MFLVLKETDPKPKNGLRLTPMLVCFCYGSIVVCIISYIIAVSTGEVPPFPWCTITDTASYYPQDILFRLVTTMGAPILPLFWYTVFCFLREQTEKHNLTDLRGFAKWIFWLGVLQGPFEGVTIATIDGGKMLHLHDICAVIFFVMFFIGNIMTTIALGELRKIDPSIITKKSLLYKRILTISLTLTWVVCLLLELVPDGEDEPNKQDYRVVIIEWVTLFSIMLYMATFRLDWQNVQYFFNDISKIQPKLIEEQNKLKISQINYLEQQQQVEEQQLQLQEQLKEQQQQQQQKLLAQQQLKQLIQPQVMFVPQQPIQPVAVKQQAGLQQPLQQYPQFVPQQNIPQQQPPVFYYQQPKMYTQFTVKQFQ